MIHLPGIPFPPVQLKQQNNDPLLSTILSKRSSLHPTISNYSTFITSLEDYLNSIYQTVLEHEDITHIDVFEYVGNIILCDSIPWIIPRKINEQISWSLKDELTIVFINLSVSYTLRSREIVESIITSQGMESQWLNSFKIFKKSLEYINFLKNQSLNNIIFETSNLFINFIDYYIQSSIQSSFLIKTTHTLKQIDYDIMMNDSINYSTMSRISIFVKDQLKNMLNILKTNNFYLIWIKNIEMLILYINAYIGILLSIENYKQDEIGKSIGFLNFSIENIAKRHIEGHNIEDSKLKKKFGVLKQKIKKEFSTKLKLNQGLQQDLKKYQSSIYIDLLNLFQLLQLLNMKYNLENNNLKFDKISDTSILLNEIPSGRALPIDFKPWSMHQSISNSGYY